ncbi:MAG: chain-length determining protein [Prevotella sp.]|nr:chain-length determining protein [Prevotella sp.]
MEEEKRTQRTETPTLELGKLWLAMKKYKKLYYTVLPLTFVVVWLLTLCYPDYYKCKVTLVPESSSGSNGMGSLLSLASSFGVNVGNAGGKDADAITPDLYPDLMKSTDFVTSLFDIKVQRDDDRQPMTYFEYLRDCERRPLWEEAQQGFFGLFSSDDDKKKKEKLDLFRLTSQQRSIMGKIVSNVVCLVDQKTNIISIDVKDQDPVVAAIVADSVRSMLQKSLTDYRTSKARHDLAYVQNLHKEAKQSYERACDLYADYVDSNRDAVLESVRQKQSRMENEMQLRYNNYNALSAQLLAAIAKVQEKTPAFTTLERATVPPGKAGPNRKLIVIVFTFLAFVFLTGWVMYKESLFKPLLRGFN